MKIKNRTWVLYNNKPHFVISCYPEETRLHTLDEKRITVPTKDLSTMVVPTFEIGEQVLYVDTYHEKLRGKLVTIVDYNNSGYAPYEVKHANEYKHVTPFDIAKINYQAVIYMTD